MVERGSVAPVVMGSIPISLPNFRKEDVMSRERFEIVYRRIEEAVYGKPKVSDIDIQRAWERYKKIAE